MPTGTMGWVDSASPQAWPVVLWDNGMTHWGCDPGELEIVEAAPGEWREFAQWQRYVTLACLDIATSWNGGWGTVVNPAAASACDHPICEVHGVRAREMEELLRRSIV